MRTISKARPNEEAFQELCEVISQAVARSKLTPQQLTEQVGISIASARKLVRGKVADVKLRTLARLAQATKLTIKA
jgi:DNA-binding Xre family transcriptional regulator